ncbi:hypothetical protein FOB50_12630 [Enterobacter hormaechei]|nr:hypothetical protein FOB50_12630 [Enterobacter hormaechei]
MYRADFAKKALFVYTCVLRLPPAMPRFSAFYERCHGVSGVGGSNPLVPTKTTQKNQPLMAGFLLPVSACAMLSVFHAHRERKSPAESPAGR